MADAAAGLLIWFAKALGKKAGAAVFQEKYGEHFLYKETIGPQEVDLSEVSLKKIVDGVTSVIKADLREQLSEQALNQAQSQLDSVRCFFTDRYPHLGGSASERDREISSWEQSLCLNVLGPLSSGDFSAKVVCLPAWMVAAAMHMAILQERANLLLHAGRENILKIHAQKYMAYAEDVYRRSYQIRMGQISEVRKNEGHKYLGIRIPSSDRKYFFTDAAALDSLRNPVKFYQSWAGADYEDDVAVVRCHYLADAQQCFEASLSRSAMVTTFRMWGAEFPGVSSSPVFVPASFSEGRVDAYLQLNDVCIHVAPTHPGRQKLLQSDQIFSFYGTGYLGGPDRLVAIGGGSHLLPAPYRVVSSTLHFKRPFLIPCKFPKPHEVHLRGEHWKPKWVEHWNPEDSTTTLTIDTSQILSMPSVNDYPLSLEFHRWSAKKQKWIHLGSSNDLADDGLLKDQVVKVVNDKLVATKSTVKRKLLTVSSNMNPGMVCYKATQIHYCAPSNIS